MSQFVKVKVICEKLLTRQSRNASNNLPNNLTVVLLLIVYLSFLWKPLYISCLFLFTIQYCVYLYFALYSFHGLFLTSGGFLTNPLLSTKKKLFLGYIMLRFVEM